MHGEILMHLGSASELVHIINFTLLLFDISNPPVVSFTPKRIPESLQGPV